jgi:predicted ArsR family transcriptional regulator
LANKEIACELNLSERTVKFHVSSLLAKFKVHSRMELMREATQRPMKPFPAAAGAHPAYAIRAFARNSALHGKALNPGKILPLARPRMMA